MNKYLKCWEITVHQEQKRIKLYQVRKHFFKAEKINNALYSMEH